MHPPLGHLEGNGHVSYRRGGDDCGIPTGRQSLVDIAEPLGDVRGLLLEDSGALFLRREDALELCDGGPDLAELRLELSGASPLSASVFEDVVGAFARELNTRTALAQLGVVQVADTGGGGAIEPVATGRPPRNIAPSRERV